MPSVELDSEEWQRIMSVLATAPWNVANPLLMKIGEQLRGKQPESPGDIITKMKEKRQ